MCSILREQNAIGTCIAISRHEAILPSNQQNQNNMKKSYLTLAGAILALTVGSAAFAAQINGSLGFTGSYTSDNNNLTLANSFTFGTVTTNGVHTGDFAGIVNGSAVVTPVALDVNPEVLPAGAIWSVGGFSLTLSSLAETFNNANTLSLQGYGTISGAGFDDTAGEWVASFTKSGSSFTFSANSSAMPSVPDGGMTAVMLGAGLLGLGVLARRRASA